MNKAKELIGRVKNNPSENWKELEGISLIVIKFEENDPLVVVRPIELKDMERFYRVSYKNSMKELISDDYDYCIWYLLDENCELNCEIDANDLEEVREVTKEDVEEHNNNLEQFKKNHRVYERQKIIEDEEKEEEVAKKEFKKEEKVKFNVLIKGNKNEEVDAIIYKGFAIHDKVDTQDNSYKMITVTDGEYKGIGLTLCNIAKCKKLIDEIREAIGYRSICAGDITILKKIISRY